MGLKRATSKSGFFERWRASEDLLADVVLDVANWAHGRLPRTARRRLDTDDLVQDAVGDLLSNVDVVPTEDRGRIFRYLQKAVRSRIATEIRRSGIGETDQMDPHHEAHPEAAADAQEHLLQKEAARIFRTALGSLSGEDQFLLVGRVDCGLSYKLLAVGSGRPTEGAARAAAQRAALRLAHEAARLRQATRSGEQVGLGTPDSRRSRRKGLLSSERSLRDPSIGEGSDAG